MGDISAPERDNPADKTGDSTGDSTGDNTDTSSRDKLGLGPLELERSGSTPPSALGGDSPPAAVRCRSSYFASCGLNVHA